MDFAVEIFQEILLTVSEWSDIFTANHRAWLRLEVFIAPHFISLSKILVYRLLVSQSIRPPLNGFFSQKITRFVQLWLTTCR